MTNKEAIKSLKWNVEYARGLCESYVDGVNVEALGLAIKALEEYPTDKEIQDDMRRTYLGGAE